MLSIIGGQPDPEPEAFYNSMYDVLKANKITTIQLLRDILLVNQYKREDVQGLSEKVNRLQFDIFVSKFRSWWEKNVGMFYLLKGKTCLQTAR